MERKLLKERDLDSSTSFEHFTHYTSYLAQQSTLAVCLLAHTNCYSHCELPMPSFHETTLAQTQMDLFKSGSGFTPVLLFCTVYLSSASPLGARAKSPSVACLQSPSPPHFWFGSSASPASLVGSLSATVPPAASKLHPLLRKGRGSPYRGLQKCPPAFSVSPAAKREALASGSTGHPEGLLHAAFGVVKFVQRSKENHQIHNQVKSITSGNLQ